MQLMIFMTFQLHDLCLRAQNFVFYPKLQQFQMLVPTKVYTLRYQKQAHTVLICVLDVPMCNGIVSKTATVSIIKFVLPPFMCRVFWQSTASLYSRFTQAFITYSMILNLIRCTCGVEYPVSILAMIKLLINYKVILWCS